MKKIFVLGNELVEADRIAIQVAVELKEKFPEINFRIVGSLDTVRKLPERPVLMDAVSGLEKVKLIEKIEELSGRNVFSLHDLDSAFQLKLLKKMGKIKGFVAIGIPVDYPLEKAVEEVSAILKKKKKELF